MLVNEAGIVTPSRPPTRAGPWPPPHALPALAVLQQALAEQLPARPTPHQVSSLVSWRELSEAILTQREEVPARPLA
jgi:hypothetical protein